MFGLGPMELFLALLLFGAGIGFLILMRIWKVFLSQKNEKEKPLSDDRVYFTDKSKSREERECPHCAELILARATHCRFCGQQVVALK
jgi:hypothetical protein